MFESALIESRRRRRPRRRLLVLPLVVALHAVVFTGYVLAHYWQVPALEEPPILVSFFQAAAPPPPPPPAAAAPAEPQRPEPTVEPEAPEEPVQPVEIPEELPEPQPVETPSSAGGAAEGGVPGGVEGGVPGGVVGGVVGGEIGGVPGGEGEGEGTGDQILRVGGDVVPPEVVERVQPSYTEVARRARIEGVVIVEAIIDRTGRVTDVRVLRGLPMGLERATVEAVERWRFRPATLGGRPVDVYFVLTVNFRLQ